MNQEELKARTKLFALRVIKLVKALPRNIESRTIARQIIRSGTSVAANYRSSCRSRSRSEFVAKVGVVLEEADETALWLELITEAGLLPMKRVEPLLAEARELVAILVSTRKTASSNLKSEI
jgi:four helix bundle protein